MTGLHDQEREQRALTAFVEHRADGIIVASCVSDPADVLARVRADRVVFVQPDYPALADGAEPPARGVVRTDDSAGVAATVRHLVDRGYRRLTYAGPSGWSSNAWRRAAATAAVEELGRRTAPLHRRRRGRVAGRLRAGPDPRRGPTRRGALLRRQAGPRPARRAALDEPGRARRHGRGRLRRDPGGAPVVATADDRRGPVGRRRPARRRDADRVGARRPDARLGGPPGEPRDRRQHAATRALGSRRREHAPRRSPPGPERDRDAGRRGSRDRARQRHQALRRRRGARRDLAPDRVRRVLLPPRAVRLRQDDHPQPDRRVHPADLG